MTIFLGSYFLYKNAIGFYPEEASEIDTKKKILGAVMDIPSLSPEEVLELYNEKMNFCN